MSPERLYGVISAVGAAASVPSGYYTVYKDGAYTYLIISLVVSASCFYLFLKTRRESQHIENKPEPVKGESSESIKRDLEKNAHRQRSDFWFVNNFRVIIDLLDSKGERAYCKHTMTLKCRKNTDCIYFRIAALDKITDLTVVPNTYHISTENRDNNVIVRFNRMINEEEEIEIEYSYTANNCFTEDEEFWSYQKYYNSDGGTIEIVFPENRRPSGFEIRLSKDIVGKYEPFNEIFSYLCINKKPTLKVPTRNVSTGQDLKIVWWW